MLLSDDEAQAAKEIAKTGGELIDAARGVGGFIRDTLGDIPKDMIGLAGGDWVHEQRRRNIGKLVAKTQRMLEDVAPDRITEPSVSVVLPLLQAAADEGREELQDLWAALLANAMVDGGKRMRRAFFDAVAKLEPADVLVFDLYTAEGMSKRIQDRAAELGLDQLAVRLAIQVLTELRCLSGDQLSPFGYELARACKPPNAAP